MGMPVITSGTVSREESIGNIISSIAMEESAIAHILNAESEKLSAIIDMSDVTANDLMAANRSVKNAIDAIIRLEISLQAKLSVVSQMICQTY